MKPILWLTALLPLLAAAQTPPAAKLLPAQSEIVFTSRQMGVPVEGRFRRFDAQVAFDPRQPESGRVTLSVDLASVAMGAAESEAEVAKPAGSTPGRFRRPASSPARSRPWAAAASR